MHPAAPGEQLQPEDCGGRVSQREVPAILSWVDGYAPLERNHFGGQFRLTFWGQTLYL